MLRTVLAAALVLLAACATRPRPAVPLQIDAAERAAITERASRSTVRPLQPPAAPDARNPVAARPAPQRTVRPPARAVQAAPAAGDGWARLRQCESSGNYANKRNPTFRGGYQFSFGTWASVGGTGDPADATPAEQDMRAQMLYARRGPRRGLSVGGTCSGSPRPAPRSEAPGRHARPRQTRPGRPDGLDAELPE